MNNNNNQKVWTQQPSPINERYKQYTLQYKPQDQNQESRIQNSLSKSPFNKANMYNINNEKTYYNLAHTPKTKIKSFHNSNDQQLSSQNLNNNQEQFSSPVKEFQPHSSISKDDQIHTQQDELFQNLNDNNIEGQQNQIENQQINKESDFNSVVQNLERMQKELIQWKKKCKLIKYIADTPINNNNFLDLDFQTYKKLHKSDIELLNNYISEISQGIKTNVDQLQLIVNQQNLKNSERQQLEQTHEVLKTVEIQTEDDKLIKQLQDEVKELINQVEEKERQIQQQNIALEKRDITSEMLKLLKDHNTNLFSELEKSNQQIKDLQKEQSDIELIINKCEKFFPSQEFLQENKILDKILIFQSNLEKNKNYYDELHEKYALIKYQLNQQEQLNSSIQMNNKELQMQIQETKLQYEDKEIKLMENQEIFKNQYEQQLQEFYKTQLHDQMTIYIQLNNQLQQEKIILQQALEDIQKQFSEKLQYDEKQIQIQIQDLNQIETKIIDSDRKISEQSELIQKQNLLIQQFNENKEQAMQSLQSDNLNKIQQIKILESKLQELNIQNEQMIEHIDQQEESFKMLDSSYQKLINERQELHQQIESQKFYQKDAEFWKSKFKLMKTQFFEQKSKFDEFKKNLLKDVQDRFQNESEVFEGSMYQVEKKLSFDPENIKKVNESISSNDIPQIDQQLQTNIQEQQKKQNIENKLQELLSLKQQYEYAIQNIQNGLGEKSK